jgi:hypothetical protein
VYDDYERSQENEPKPTKWMRHQVEGQCNAQTTKNP